MHVHVKYVNYCEVICVSTFIGWPSFFVDLFHISSVFLVLLNLFAEYLKLSSISSLLISSLNLNVHCAWLTTRPLYNVSRLSLLNLNSQFSLLFYQLKSFLFHSFGITYVSQSTNIHACIFIEWTVNKYRSTIRGEQQQHQSLSQSRNADLALLDTLHELLELRTNGEHRGSQGSEGLEKAKWPR